MSNLISGELRLLVRSRAEGLCEYCLLHEDDCLFALQIDHIISVKHGGVTDPDNLALACIFCNRQKGSDVGTIHSIGTFVRFFNPRSDSWSDHFRLDGGVIEPISPVGEGTARIFKFNDPERVMEREEVATRGRYPTLHALARMRS
ncbi:MAG: HNH endonuclease [Limisphaerales bacterium]